MGLGLAEFSYSDGRSGRSAFTWFEQDTATAVGSGTFTDGRTALFWAGNNLESHFCDMLPEQTQTMDCAMADLLLG